MFAVIALALIITAVLGGSLYVGVTTYDRYKQNQAKRLNEEAAFGQLSPAMQEKVEVAVDNILDEAEVKQLFSPENSQIVQQTLFPKEKEVMSLYLAERQFEDYKKEYLRTCYKFEGTYGDLVHDPHDTALAHNHGLEQMHNFLLDKHLRYSSGNQAADFFAMNPPKVVPDRKYKIETAILDVEHPYDKKKYGSYAEAYQASVGSPHAIPMPAEMSAVTAGKAQEEITKFINTPLDKLRDYHHSANPDMWTIVRALQEQADKVESEKEGVEVQKVTKMIVTALTAISTKLEDDEFHTKVMLEERDKEIALLKEKLASVPTPGEYKLEAFPSKKQPKGEKLAIKLQPEIDVMTYDEVLARVEKPKRSRKPVKRKLAIHK